MSAVLAGFIAALFMAAFVVVWITYCMFCREQHKSEFYQYNISDIQQKHVELSMENPTEKKSNLGLAAGIFILPTGRRHKDDGYMEKRPDYPESPAPIVHGTEKLVDVFNDSTLEAGGGSRESEFCIEIDSGSQYHSEV